MESLAKSKFCRKRCAKQKDMVFLALFSMKATSWTNGIFLFLVKSFGLFLALSLKACSFILFLHLSMTDQKSVRLPVLFFIFLTNNFEIHPEKRCPINCWGIFEKSRLIV